jgi:hypothetical protein
MLRQAEQDRRRGSARDSHGCRLGDGLNANFPIVRINPMPRSPIIILAA